MPLTAKGEKIESAMEEQYGEKKGEQIFYASKNAGTIKGVDGDDCDSHRAADATLDTADGSSGYALHAPYFVKVHK